MTKWTREYLGAMPDAEKFEQHPEEYFPVAYRVSITGIWMADSSFDPEEAPSMIREVAEDIIFNDTAAIRVHRQTDAKPPTKEQLAEWDRINLEHARQTVEQNRRKEKAKAASSDPSTFEGAVKLVSDVYEVLK